ncbi:MAG: TonB-dependent receptor plug domain-containing protein [Desulfosudaceae bacterium]
MKQSQIVWLVVLLLGVVPVWGQAPPTVRPDSPQMRPVVVTAGRVAEDRAEVPTNITVVDKNEIQQSAAEDLRDLLAGQGFMTREYPNSTSSVSIRGFRTDTHGNDLASHVLILINGRRAGTGNLEKISLGNVERVEIIRGPASVQYGSAAMGGIVNVITEEGKEGVAGYAEGILGSWDYYRAGAGISGRAAEFDFSFSASTESQGDYDTAAGDRYDNTGFDHKNRVSLNTGWNLAPGHRLGLAVNSYDGDKIGKPGYLTDNDPDDYIDNAINTVDMSYDGGLADDSLAWKLRYFTGEDEYATIEPGTPGSDETYFRDTDQQGGQAQMTVNTDLVSLTGGVDWTYYAIDNTYTSGENTYDNPAAFVLSKFHLLDDRLILSAGGRHDWYEVKSDDGRSEDDTNWVTSLGLVYKVTPELIARANYAEAFRMPTADELYMYEDYSMFGFGIFSGNPDLKPESSQTYEVGLDYSKKMFTAGLNWFYTDFADKITYAYNPVTDITLYENAGEANLTGFEGNLSFDIGALFQWNFELAPYASFTWLTAYEDEETDEDLLYTPDWTASYGLRFAHWEADFTARLNVAYVGEQEIEDYAGTGDETLPAHTVADLTLSKGLLSGENDAGLFLEAEIRNLFEERYEVIQGYPMPGRSFYTGLKYRF